MVAANLTSLYDFFVSPKFVNSIDQFGCVQTSILRYYLTACTGKRLKSQRLSSAAIAKQTQKLKNIPVDSSFDIDAHLKLLIRGGEMYGVTGRKMHPYMSFGKKFFEFVSSAVVPTEKQVNKDDILRYGEAIMDKSEWVSGDRHVGKKTILEEDPQVYLQELKNKYPNLSEDKLYEKARSSLQPIFQTLDSFAEYQQCRKTSIKHNVDEILRFIGWYKQYRGLSIDEISIDKIFPIISPYIEYDVDDLSEDDFTEIAKKEWFLKRKVKDKSKKFIAIVNKYINVYSKKNALKTKIMKVWALIVFGRFLYRDITDVEENDDFQDISLVNRLKVYARDLGKCKPVAEDDVVIPFNWQEVEAVCERIRKEANQDYKYCAMGRNKRGDPLTKRSKAIHIQDFLALAFFCVMPPDRQRTFRQLTFGETLKYGLRDKELNTFTSYEKLAKGQEPRYYIHLLPHQYKTGDTYGTYWHEIKNVKYEDGKHFYDYLNQWLFEGYRDELATAGKTNAVFIRARTGISFAETEGYLSSGYYSKLIKSIFRCKTKYPLRPHDLRRVFVTHINNIGLSEEERAALAYMMHHKLETANKIYNKQTSDERIALGVEFLDKHLSSHQDKIEEEVESGRKTLFQ